mgnify:CR=1 FL=1
MHAVALAHGFHMHRRQRQQRGRLEGQAPEIDPVVYLAECDPDTVRPGQIVEARVTGAKDYDLVAVPISSS